MQKDVFLRIVQALGKQDLYFQQQVDATGRMDFSLLQKYMIFIRILAYGSSTDNIDYYVRIGGTMTLLGLDKFVKGIHIIFGVEYLRRPNNNGIQYLMQICEIRGFQSMLGSIDYLHWKQKTCLVAWKGQYCHGDGPPTIMLKVVVSQYLRI